MENNENHVHSFENIVVPATCQERGYTLHRCACGYEHKDQFTGLGKHAYTITSEQAPTCESTGLRSFQCTVCGEEKAETLSALGHSWSKWAPQTFATCTTDGLQTRQCTRCGVSQEQAIPAKGHKCKSQKTPDGRVEYFCANCGEPMEKPVKPKKEKKPLSKKAVTGIIAGAVAVVTLAVGAFVFSKTKMYDYYAAKHHIKKDQGTEAYVHLLKSNDYKDSKKLLKDFQVNYKKITTTTIEYDESGEVISEIVEETKSKFDKKGNMTERIYYDENGNVGGKYIFEYNKDGKRTKYSCYNDYDYLEYEYIYNFDKKGNQTEALYYEDGDLDEKRVYEYDSDGNRIKQSVYDKYDNLDYEYTYKYDDDGNMIEQTRYDSDGERGWTYKSKYDDDGNEIEYACYDADGTLQYKYKYTLDDEGNCTHTTFYDSDGEEETWRSGKYTYDKYGVAVKSISYYNNEEEEMISTEIELSSDYQKETRISYSYSYDDNNDPYIRSKTITEYSGMVAVYRP